MGQWKVAIHTNELRASCSGHDQSIRAQPEWEGHLLRKAASTGYLSFSRKKKTSSNRVRRVSARKGEGCAWVSAQAKWHGNCMANGMSHCYEKSEPEPGRGHLVEQKRFMECQSWSELRRASMVAKEILQRIIQGYLVHPLSHLPAN